MGQLVIHFEVIGRDPKTLRSYYGELFGWEFDTSGPAGSSSRYGPRRRASTDPEGHLMGVAGIS